MDALWECSKEAKVFVLIHKMDTILEKDRDDVFNKKKKQITESIKQFKIELYQTSIWDETLYQAWSKIAHCLIPKIDKIESGLKHLCELCSADELVLFEKSTFLEISHIELKPHKDPHRFEKISNIIKQFKLSLFATNYQFEEMAVKSSKFRSYLIDFTRSTYLMVVLSNNDVEETALKFNISTVKPFYGCDSAVAAQISHTHSSPDSRRSMTMARRVSSDRILKS